VNAQLEPPHARAATLAELRNGFLRSSSADSAEALDARLAGYPDDVDAHLLRIARLVVAKDLGAFPALQRALSDAEPYWPHARAAARRHAQAAALWFAHRPLHAAHVYSTICANDPHDLLALRLAQSCWYFLGRRAKVHAVAERALRAWSPGENGYDIVLAMTAFGCDEIGHAKRADELAARAIEIEPEHPYAIHARAHALAALGLHAKVVAFLDGCGSQWRIGGRLDSHIAWHLAVSELARGEVGAAVAALESELAPLAARGPSAAFDATDLAWRLDLAEVDTGSTWERLANAWARHPAPGFWPPYDLLAGIAYLRSRTPKRANALRQRLLEGPHVRPCAVRAARAITLPALGAIEAFARGALAAAETQLRSTIDGMAGSLLQRELFEITLRAVLRSRAASATRPAAWRIPA
jgi:tetratricopeptide (TPR) repeat protein